MSIELHAKVKELESRVRVLEESVALLLAPPVRPAVFVDPEPKDKRTREWREWAERQPTQN